MIHKPKLIYNMLADMIPRIELAHETLARFVAILRDSSVDIWTGENQSVPPATGYSASGWLNHFASERARLVALRDAGAGAIMQRVYPEMTTAAAAYAQDIPTIIGYIQTAIDRHAGNEKLTNGERTNLANAIAGLLEP